MPTFKVQGQVYHFMGSLMPQLNEPAKFLQIYFMGDSQWQCDRRCKKFQTLDRSIVISLQEMLHTHNDLVSSFKTAMEQLHPNSDFHIVIRSDERPVDEHECCFNAPATKKVAILPVSEQHDHRNIIIHHQDSMLTCISETYWSYNALQYPQIFWQGQDGCHFNISQVNLATKHRIFGKTICHMYTIEWQKQGLLHAHKLIWLKDKIHPNQTDSIISAKLPDTTKRSQILWSHQDSDGLWSMQTSQQELSLHG
ncbi:uncharacterized protein LOC118762544 [Octopus sinensis]|uniref:Uncharacterized protein LOC118762544 n=1 Tax=Octopus sinensis TaxID=2607531 RepID=A0A7E6ENB8_9MOLL|nr:uncharacterized protein LOC118762544 [Octopus sinensis]